MRKHTVEIRYDLCRKLFDDKGHTAPLSPASRTT